MRKEVSKEIIFKLFEDSIGHVDETTYNYQDYEEKEKILKDAIRNLSSLIPNCDSQELEYRADNAIAAWGYLTFLEGMKAAINLLSVFDPATANQLEF